MTHLQILILPGCFGCDEAVRLYERAAQSLHGVTVELVNLLKAPERKPPEVAAVPAYVLNGTLVFTGNPSWTELEQTVRDAQARLSGL